VRRWDAGHRGVDLAGFAGAPVVAAGAGIVLFAGRVVDQGVVVVGHGVLRTSYEPVEPGVVVGARVVTGQRIGTLDVGHCAATACLHWGLLSGHAHATVYYDPLLLLGCGAVRLEPEPAAEPAGRPATEPAAEPTAEPAAEPTAEPAVAR
jgi:murein DD-endopeptidase MepM/ murein hydrolase activator NlpD